MIGNVAKTLGVVLFAALAVVALLFVVVESVRKENEDRDRHHHLRYGCRETCVEPDCFEAKIK